jgi:hypothetical protein
VKALNSKSTKLFEYLIKNLSLENLGECIQNNDIFMPVHVDFMGSGEGNKVYAIAHYSEQNGDLCANPSVLFFKSKDGLVIPYVFQMDGIGLNQEYAVINDKYELTATLDAAQIVLADFCNDTWFPNILQQQEIKL